MSEEVQGTETGGSSMMRNVIIGIVGAYILFSLFFSYKMSERIEALEGKQKASEAALGSKIAAAQSQIAETNDTLHSSVGETKKELAARAAELQRQQKASETRLSEEQQKQQA